MAKNGVYCLEGEWNSDLRDRASVLPILELLERLGLLKFIHRDVATRSELEHYLKKWSQARYSDYRVLYLATHGGNGSLQWSQRNATALDDLADVLRTSAAGRYVYLGSCRTLFDSGQARRFREQTQAAAVLGYRKDVDWLEGAAFEVILLSSLANHTGRPATVFNQLMNRHAGLARLYKFVMVTKDGELRSQDHA